VLATTPDGDALFVRQLRPAVRAYTLEIPAGLLDVAGESPQACAVRELVEETGHEARNVRPLGSFFTSAGMTDERFHLYRADAVPIGGSVAEEGIDVVRLRFHEAVERARAGGFDDTKTELALLLAAAEDAPGT
jgi:ADP-ribose pyrophosphatase